jgi:hypothetical protein
MENRWLFTMIVFTDGVFSILAIALLQRSGWESRPARLSGRSCIAFATGEIDEQGCIRQERHASIIRRIVMESFR